MRKRSVHPLPLSLFLANSAIFAFKKKGKGAEVEELSDELGEIDFDDGLKLTETGDIDFGGGSNSLGSSDDLDEIHLGIPEGSMPETGTPKKKIDEMNATIMDLQDQLERSGLQVKGVRNDLDGLKTEMAQVNESIKKMLCVYEAISREYNPFVDGRGDAGPDSCGGPKLFGGAFSSTSDEELDRVIRPDGVSDRLKDEEAFKPKGIPSDLAGKRLNGQPPADRGLVSDSFAAECMKKISQIVDLKNEKERTDQTVERAYLALMGGIRPDPADVAYLEDWCAKLRR